MNSSVGWSELRGSIQRNWSMNWSSVKFMRMLFGCWWQNLLPHPFFFSLYKIEVFYILLLMFFRKLWLKSVGSPSSRIDRAVFSNERDISKLEIHGFSTRYWTSSVTSHRQKTVTTCCYSKWNWKVDYSISESTDHVGLEQCSVIQKMLNNVW